MREAAPPKPTDAFHRVLGSGGPTASEAQSGVARSPLLDLTDELGVPVFRCSLGSGSQTRTLLLSGKPVLTEQGTLLGWLAVFRDIAKEESARRAKDELIENVSHELRTPLTSIKGFVDLLRFGLVGALTPQQTELLNLVAEEASRLTSIVNDLLDVDRLNAASLQREPFDIGVLIREVVDEQRACPKPSVSLVQLDAAKPIAVLADRERLRQVLTNLVSNGVKYTPSGSVTVQARTEGREVVVEVRDTGIGIKPEDQARLFERFFRANDPQVREIGGTGLGLAIVQRIVAAHGGKVAVTSAPGSGSTFTFTVPARGDAP